MKRSTPILLAPLLFTAAAFGHAQLVSAQVETIDPNPTMPRDVGGKLTYRSGISDGGFRLGRAIGAQGTDPNPADTMLRSIDGSNYGHHTGHSIFSRSAPRRGAVPQPTYRAQNARARFRGWPNVTPTPRNALQPTRAPRAR